MYLELHLNRGTGSGRAFVSVMYSFRQQRIAQRRQRLDTAFSSFLSPIITVAHTQQIITYTPSASTREEMFVLSSGVW